MNIELRSATAAGSPGTIAGCIAYNSDSEALRTHGGGSFVERIAPGAFAQTLASRTSVVLTAGHRSEDPLAVLARWPTGDLLLRDTAAGLEWSAQLPDTQAAHDLVALIRSGAINSHSFEFSLRPGGETWTKRDKVEVRTITSAALLEINPVTSPAYPANTLQARSLFMSTKNKFHTAPARRGLDLAAAIGADSTSLEFRLSDSLAVEARDMTAGTAGQGGNTIGTAPVSLLAALQARSVTAALGATVLEGLKSDTPLPLLSAGEDAVPLAETGTATTATTSFSGGTLRPKRLSVSVEVSEMLRIQNPAEFTSQVLAALGGALAARVDYFAINGLGTGEEPTGLLNTAGIGAIVIGTDGGAPTAAHLESLEELVGDRDRNAGFAVSSPMRRKLRRLGIWNDNATGGPLIGTRAVVSRNIRSGVTKGTATTVSPIVYGGDWSRLVIGFFGTPTVYTGPARANGFRSVVLGVWFDIAAREPAAFAVLRDSTTAA